MFSISNAILDKDNGRIYIDIMEFYEFVLNYPRMDEALTEFFHREDVGENNTAEDFAIFVEEIDEKYNVPLSTLFHLISEIDKINGNRDLHEKTIIRCQELIKDEESN